MTPRFVQSYRSTIGSLSLTDGTDRQLTQLLLPSLAMATLRAGLSLGRSVMALDPVPLLTVVPRARLSLFSILREVPLVWDVLYPPQVSRVVVVRTSSVFSITYISLTPRCTVTPFPRLVAGPTFPSTRVTGTPA